MKVYHCLAIVLGLCMIVSATSDALADCGYYKPFWLWPPEVTHCREDCTLWLCYLRCKQPSSRGASRFHKERPCFHSLSPS